MLKRHTFTCFVIGGTDFAIKCSSMILSRGHTIFGVLPLTPDFRAWVVKNNLVCFDSMAELQKAAEAQPFEYLFSLENLVILRDSILCLPKKFGINYHDGPLPKYAGINTAPWAIINGETNYGTAWHVLKTKIDAGEIIKSSSFEILPNDTSFTLYNRCYLDAMCSFPDLVEDLELDNVTLKAQNISERTYCALTDRPQFNGIIDWSSGSKVAERLVRATTFEKSRNEIGHATLLCKDQLIYVGLLQILNEASEKVPGEIIKITKNGMRVATSDNDVVISELFDVGGRPVLGNDLTQRFGLAEGYRLQLPDLNDLETISAQVGLRFRHEYYWIKQWLNFNPLPKDLLNRSNVQNNHTPTFQMSSELKARFGNTLPFPYLVSSVFAQSLCMYLSVQKLSIGVNFSENTIHENSPSIENLFLSTFQPFNFEIPNDENFELLLNNSAEQLKYMTYHLSYLRDLALRVSELKHISEVIGDASPFPITISFTGNRQVTSQLPTLNNFLRINIDKSGDYNFESSIEKNEFLKIVNFISTKMAEIFSLIKDNKKFSADSENSSFKKAA